VRPLMQPEYKQQVEQQPDEAQPAAASGGR